MGPDAGAGRTMTDSVVNTLLVVLECCSTAYRRHSFTCAPIRSTLWVPMELAAPRPVFKLSTTDNDRIRFRRRSSPTTLSAFTANSSGVGAAALNQVGQYSGQPCTSRLDRDVVCDRLGRTDPEGSDGRISGAVLAKRYYPSLLM